MAISVFSDHIFFSHISSPSGEIEMELITYGIFNWWSYHITSFGEM